MKISIKCKKQKINFIPLNKVLILFKYILLNLNAFCTKFKGKIN